MTNPDYARLRGLAAKLSEQKAYERPFDEVMEYARLVESAVLPLLDRVEQMEKAMGEMVIPLAAIDIGVTYELNDALKAEIKRVLEVAMELLRGKEPAQ